MVMNIEFEKFNLKFATPLNYLKWNRLNWMIVWLKSKQCNLLTVFESLYDNIDVKILFWYQNK